jgi:hypothetical protein
LPVRLPELYGRAELELIGEKIIPVLQVMQPHEHVALSFKVNADIACIL